MPGQSSANQKSKKFQVAEGINLDLYEPSSETSVPGFQPIQTKTCQIDGVIAAEMLQHFNCYKHQRRCNDARVKEYARRMQKGLWHHTNIILARVIKQNRDPITNSKGEQRCVLLNGQHTLTAVAESNVMLPITLLVYEMTTREIDQFFAQIDDIKNRTQTDVLAPYCKHFGQRTISKRGKEEEVDIVTPQHLNRITKAIWFAQHGRSKGRKKVLYKDMQIDLAQEHTKFVNWLISLNHKPENPFKEVHIWTQPAISAMYITWCYGQNEEEATEFWRRVTMNCDHAPGTPTHSLNTLMSLAANDKKLSSSQKGTLLFQACADCWNHHVEHGLDAEFECDWNKLVTLKDKLEPAYFSGNTYDEETVEQDAIGLDIPLNPDDEMKVGHTDHRSNVTGKKRAAAKKPQASTRPKKSKTSSKKTSTKSGTRTSAQLGGQKGPLIRM